MCQQSRNLSFNKQLINSLIKAYIYRINNRDPRIELKEEKIILGINQGTSIMDFGFINKKGFKFEMIMMDI